MAIGTAHGLYKSTPKLDIERISLIKEKVSVPLVLHGGTGLGDDVVRECVQRGMCKVNFATELRVAYTNAVKELLASTPELIDPKKLGVAGMEAVKNLVKSKMLICGCDGRA